MCNIVFLIFGNVYYSDKKSIEYEINQRNRVEFDFNNKPDLNNIVNDLSEYEQIKNILISTEDEKQVKIAAYISDLTNEPEMHGGEFFSKTNIENADNVFTISDMSCNEYILQSNIKIGDYFNIKNSVLKCIGTISSNEYDILIPFRTFTKHNFEKVKVEFIFRNGASLLDIENINNNITNKYSPTSVLRPNNSIGFNVWDFLSDMSDILILLIISIINYLFIYKFLLSKRLLIYSIFKLCGLSKRKIMFMLLFELVFFFIISTVISFIIYILYLLVVNEMRLFTSLLYEVGISFIVNLILNLFMFMSTLIKVTSKSTIELKREGER